ncbi:glycosyltransferase [Candidatus Bathyarchaeota archaeon]|nr:glycosyltransferase [Candidatus Bathyarchaeota archaeon]
MINDCSFIGETILSYLPNDIEKQQIKRTRQLWSKTIGIAYAIMRLRADIYHVHYLLQDCDLALRFGKTPLVGHAHGSDVRQGLLHPIWKAIVIRALKYCNRIFVSTPDILERAKDYRPDAEYLPNPVDTILFYPRPLMPHEGKLRVLIASSCNWEVKGTDVAIRALSKLKETIDLSIVAHGKDFERTILLARSLKLPLNILQRAPHRDMREYYWSSDVVIDSFRLGSLGMISLEAISCGRPIVTYVSSRYPQYSRFPLKNVNTEEEIIASIQKADLKLWEQENSYLKENHAPQDIAKRLLLVYDKLAHSNSGDHDG